MTVSSGSDSFETPAVSEHTDICRVLLFQWRLRNAGLAAVNDVARFPCGCAETGGTRRPWRLAAAPHPSWCVVGGDHPWTECTITEMVPKEGT